MGSRPSPFAAWIRLATERPLFFFAGALVVGLFAALAEHTVGDLSGRLEEPGLGARWIWAQGVAERAEPVSFWAVRDVELDRARPATLVMACDESCVAWVNGVRVGSGAYREGAPADSYSVDSLLRAGWNRLIVEARSDRGVGGLLLSLRLEGEERPILVSDAGWRILEPSRLWLAGHELPAEAGEAPQVWSRPPAGRWRPGAAQLPRPSLVRALGLLDPDPPGEAIPRLLRYADPSVEPEWVPTRPGYFPGNKVIFDFGEVVEGFLELEPVVPRARPGAGAQPEGERPGALPPALLYTGVEEPMPRDQRPAAVILPRRGTRWYDAIPRRFRYIALVGAPPLARIAVRRPTELHRDAYPPRVNGPSGVFGLPPAKDYTPAEEAVWDRLGGRLGVETHEPARADGAVPGG